MTPDCRLTGGGLASHRGLAICLVLVACAQPSMTGTYAAKDAGGLVMVDLVQSENGALTGRLEALSVKPDGQVSDDTAGLTGMRDKDAVSLSIKANSFLSVTKQLSASIDGGSLTVTFPGASALKLDRVSMSQFVADATALRTAAAEKAKQVMAQQQAAEAARKAGAQLQADEQRRHSEQEQLADYLPKLAGAMDGFAASASRLNESGPKVVASYDHVTKGMEELLTREQSVAGQDRYVVMRGQMSVALSQRSIGTDQFHNDVERRSRDLTNAIGQIETGIQAALTRCQSPSAVSSPLLIMRCKELSARVDAHRNRAKSALATMAELESHYLATAARQRIIVRSSEEAE